PSGLPHRDRSSAHQRRPIMFALAQRQQVQLALGLSQPRNSSVCVPAPTFWSIVREVGSPSYLTSHPSQLETVHPPNGPVSNSKQTSPSGAGWTASLQSTCSQSGAPPDAPPLPGSEPPAPGAVPPFPPGPGLPPEPPEAGVPRASVPPEWEFWSQEPPAPPPPETDGFPPLLRGGGPSSVSRGPTRQALSQKGRTRGTDQVAVFEEFRRGSRTRVPVSRCGRWGRGFCA